MSDFDPTITNAPNAWMHKVSSPENHCPCVPSLPKVSASHSTQKKEAEFRTML